MDRLTVLYVINKQTFQVQLPGTAVTATTLRALTRIMSTQARQIDVGPDKIEFKSITQDAPPAQETAE